MSYIYKIINDINDKVYIGATNFSLEKRWKEHIRDSRKILNRDLYNDMRLYGIEHFKIELIEESSCDELYYQEVYWINRYNSFYNGYNSTLGGVGKQTIVKRLIYDEWKRTQNCAEIARKFNICHDSVLKIIRSFGEKPCCNKWVNERSKKVFMIDKNSNKILKEFKTITEASRYLIKELKLIEKNEKTYGTHISEVCRGLRKSCLGFKWKYVSEIK